LVLGLRPIQSAEKLIDVGTFGETAAPFITCYTKHMDKLNLPFEISPSVSGLVLHMQENDNSKEDSYVEMNVVYFSKINGEENRWERVKFTFDRFLSGRMYCMGGETRYGIGVLHESLWLKELNDLQLRNYPNYPDNFKNVKHYYFRGHDVNIEVLAEGFKWATLLKLDW
jgi:hypothetical protein